MSVTSGFLVLKRFEHLFREFAAKPEFDRRIYALPVFGDDPSTAAIRYRGLDRNAVKPYASGCLAEIRMAELDPDDTGGGFIGPLEHALDVLRWAEQESPGVFELAWSRVAGTPHAPPAAFELLGLEPSYFTGDHFSASCDSLCFPRWHGTDPEGLLFVEHFRRLNRNGLFQSAEEAKAFLAYYLSFDWTETGEYEIAEVWAPVASLESGRSMGV